MKKQTQFENGRNDVKSILTMVYGDFDGPRRRKNKPNSKPNKANSPAFGLIHRGKTIPIPIQDNRDEAATRPPLAGNPRQDESSRMTEHNLKKQSQFAKGQNGVKSVLIMSYGDFDGPRRRKDKPNSKPNKFVLSTVEWSQSPAFGRKS